MAVPEERARETIDKKLAHSSWIVQSHDEVIVAAERTQGRKNVSQTRCKTEYKNAPGRYPRGVLVCGAEEDEIRKNLKGLVSNV